jgi:hypothetical protein
MDEKTSNAIKLRVCIFLKHWIEKNFKDLASTVLQGLPPLLREWNDDDILRCVRIYKDRDERFQIYIDGWSVETDHIHCHFTQSNTTFSSSAGTISHEIQR